MILVQNHQQQLSGNDMALKLFMTKYYIYRQNIKQKQDIF